MLTRYTVSIARLYLLAYYINRAAETPTARLKTGNAGPLGGEYYRVRHLQSPISDRFCEIVYIRQVN